VEGLGLYLLEASPYGLWIGTAVLCVWLGVRLGNFQRDVRELRKAIDAMVACHLRVEQRVEDGFTEHHELRRRHDVLRAQTESLDGRLARVEYVLGGPAPTRRT
jgi:hypothetical protein